MSEAPEWLMQGLAHAPVFDDLIGQQHAIEELSLAVAASHGDPGVPGAAMTHGTVERQRAIGALGVKAPPEGLGKKIGRIAAQSDVKVEAAP